LRCKKKIDFEVKSDSDTKNPKIKKTFFKDGSLKTQIQWIDDNYFSEYQSYYQNGRLKAKSIMLKKAPSMSDYDTYSLETYNDNEQPVYSGECFIGLEEFRGETCQIFSGKYRIYNLDGELEGEQTFSRGKLDGESKKISTETITVSKYEKDKIVKKTIFDKKTNKIIKTEEYFEDGSRK
jgi:antitoxin component YwqK of YwqJK toxin-antitoxin module